MYIFKIIIKEWELSIFVVVLLLCIGMPINWYLREKEDVIPEIERPLPEDVSEELGPDKTFYHLYNSTTLEMDESGNPFILQPPPKLEPPSTDAETEETEKPAPNAPPAQPVEEEEIEPEPEPPPTVKVGFNGVITDSKGTKWSLIKDFEKGTAEYRKEGESTMSLEIVDISRHQLKVILPSGDSAGIDSGETLTYELK